MTEMFRPKRGKEFCWVGLLSTSAGLGLLSTSGGLVYWVHLRGLWDKLCFSFLNNLPFLDSIYSFHYVLLVEGLHVHMHVGEMSPGPFNSNILRNKDH